MKRRLLLLATEATPRTHPVFEVVAVPPLTIVPRFAAVKTALGRLEQSPTLVLASVHAVDSLFGALASVGLDARALFGHKVAAVGAATAARLQRRGVRADFVGQAGGAALATQLLAEAEGPALLLGAHGGRQELSATLAAAGWRVETVAAYDSLVDEPALRAAWCSHRQEPFFGVAFCSPKGARAFLELAEAPPSEALAGVRIGAIGATTRAALVAAGLGVDALPAVPELGLLIDALASLE